MDSLHSSAAARLVGPNPTGALRTLTLAVRAHLQVLEPPATLLLAVSGGPDSLALALAVTACAPALGHRVAALTVDHQARPGSGTEAREVRDRLRALGIADAEVATVTPAGGGGPEGRLREARWQALRRRAGELEGALILTGHTADDQAETVLLALARGSGTHALAAMASGLEVPGATVHRPLLTLRRQVLRDALTEVGLTWIDDPTNRADGPWRAADGSPLRRAAVREDALPALARSLGVDPVAALARTARLARRDCAALDAWARTVLEGARLPAGDARCVLAVGGLEGLPEAVLARVVRAASLEAGARPGDLAATHVDEIVRLVTDWRGQGPLDLPGRLRVHRVAGAGRVEWRRASGRHSV